MAPNNRNDRVAHFDFAQIVAPCGKQKEFHSRTSQNEKEEEFDNELGNYSAAVTPLISVAVGIACGVYTFGDYPPDPRTQGWFLIDSPFLMVIIAAIYILFSMVWGPQLMRGREPMKLKEVMMVYNMFQVVISFYIFMEVGTAGWFFDYNLRCQPCDYSLNEKAVRVIKVAHIYFLTKLLDFLDTVFFIMRGKFNQVTNLHVIHHSCMFMSMWFGIRFHAGGHTTFLGFLNSFVHTVMYTYYLLAALGPRVRPYLWWKKYLTKLQLTQFVLIFLHTAQLLVFPCKGVPTSLALWIILYAAIFFVLFINFYVKAYLYGPKKSAMSAPTSVNENGHCGSDSGARSNGINENKAAHRRSNRVESK